HPDRSSALACNRCGDFVCEECIGRDRETLCAICMESFVVELRKRKLSPLLCAARTVFWLAALFLTAEYTYNMRRHVLWVNEVIVLIFCIVSLPYSFFLSSFVQKNGRLMKEGFELVGDTRTHVYLVFPLVLLFFCLPYISLASGIPSNLNVYDFNRSLSVSVTAVYMMTQLTIYFMQKTMNRDLKKRLSS
ncbi:MAG: hypothetical protein P1V97_32510, partial [Planctomycetota bacterium]|nr:hypothetical protein [Planctomycetota bacterium]